MSKKPPITRPYGDYGLTGECAYLWALFLANEADFAGDYTNYDKFRSIADSLKPQVGKPVPASVHHHELEQAIERYQK